MRSPHCWAERHDALKVRSMMNPEVQRHAVVVPAASNQAKTACAGTGSSMFSDSVALSGMPRQIRRLFKKIPQCAVTANPGVVLLAPRHILPIKHPASSQFNEMAKNSHHLSISTWCAGQGFVLSAPRCCRPTMGRQSTIAPLPPAPI